MGNEHTDAKTWPDDVETYPATAQDLATYAHSRHALAQFQAPLLVSQQSPHTRLFVACFDGTGNDKHKDPQHITNIGILSDQLDLAYSRGINNIRGHYVPGVGTQDDALPRIADGALGYSYGPRMEEMYLKFIRQVHDWRKKDPQAEISILSTGFSRGAVTAAMFTRMVHERGIQDPIGMKIDQGPHGEILKLTPTHPPLVPPGRTAQVVGLLDPVATGEMNFHDVRLPPSVVSGLQLSARDERRDLFPAKDILHPGHSHDGRFLNLVHPGAHSDIGGSYRLDGLSVRNGNLLIDYVNSLSDKPFLQPRAVSSAPEMNVIHRSEQHGSYYTTTMATTLGHRVHVHDLAGPAMTLAPFDAQSLDAELRAHFPLRPVAVSTEHTDPALPAFFRERPHASAAPPLPAYLQQGATPHAVGAPSTHTASTNADTSSSSSSADASTPSQAMDKHSRMQDDLVAQQHQQRIQQAQPLAQSFTQTHAPPSHDSAPAHEKPASVDMQEQARIAQLQQQEQQAQAAREQQQRLAQQHAQLHRQAVDAQQREHEQRHNQDTRSHPHEQRQAGEAMLYTPPTRPPRLDEHLQDFRQPDHPMHSRYTQFKNALEQSHTLPRNGDKLPYGPAQQERLAAGFTDALGIDPQYEHSIRGFKQHQGQLLAYDQPYSFTEKSHVLRIDPEQALAKSPEQHAASWKAREASHPESPSRVIAPITITAEDMRHPAHPRHAMFEQARNAIANANERWGRPAP
ncbi:T6SS phospholipase effector Tle1-like catalytic domain-containing protein, partial [Xanthomonas albilineans]